MKSMIIALILQKYIAEKILEHISEVNQLVEAQFVYRRVQLMDTAPTAFPTVYPPSVPSDGEDYPYFQDKPDKYSCNQYVIKNKTHLIYGGYEGIPENLLINFLGWILLLCLFTVLRKKAWNYGRLALVQKYESRTKHLGFSQYNVWTQLFYGKETDMGKVAGEADSVSSLEFNMHIDKGLFSWIPALFKIKDEQILAKSERDAVSYLYFQRHIIVYMMIVCVISIVIVLPINFQGTLEGGQKEFGHTTLANLNPQSRLMWVHVTLAFLFLPLGIFFTRRFSKKLELREVTTSVSRTLMITRVPRRSCHKDTILKHFQEAYPEIDVQDVQFAYNIRSLIAYDKERYVPEVDAIEYYTEEEARLANHVENEKIKALQQPTGVAYVTFDTIENAKKVMRDHKNKCDCLRVTPVSSVSAELKPHNWIIRVAPAPEDIYWANLSVTNRHWWLKAIILNIMLFVVLFFLTTPAVIINGLDIILLSEKIHSMSPVLSEFLPTLLLWTMAALMPVIVSYSDQFMSHWTRSSENHSIMRKTFVFLLFMVIILPSLGLTSNLELCTLYMVFKHLVDKYNIYFAYGPSRISRNIHTSAINFVIVSIVCLQLSLLFFSIIRQGLKKDITIYSIVLLIITCLVFITHNAFHWFKDLSPVEYKKFGDGQSNGDISVSDDGPEEEISTTEVACKFVPPVLRDAPTGVESSYSFIPQPRSYGTRPREEDGFTLDNGTFKHGEDSPKSQEREQDDLYQDYSQPRVTTVSAEINVPPTSQPHTEEEEETVYTRASPQQPSPTVITVDGTVATASTPPVIHSNQRHSYSGLDNSAPATNV
nr:calcium permeable stress-gated cation channel 1-like [Cherax quadricarinatus]